MSPTTTVVVNRTRQTHPRNLRRTGRPCLRPRIGRVHCSASVVHGNTLHRGKKTRMDRSGNVKVKHNIKRWKEARMDRSGNVSQT